MLLSYFLKSQNGLTFKVYHKCSNKNDTFLLPPKQNQIIVGSYLQALRICSPQYLDEEFKYIKHFLKNLKYPRFFILNTRKKTSTYTH